MQMVRSTANILIKVHVCMHAETALLHWLWR